MDSIGGLGPAPSSSLADVVGRLEIGDEIFWDAQYLGATDDGIGHIPFAFWLFRALRPAAVVALTPSHSNSYLAFCQAIAGFGIECRACAVEPAPADGEASGVDRNAPDYPSPSYAQFSTVLQLELSQLRSRLQDGSVDLLHIAGMSTPEAARQAFEILAACLSDRSVVLIDDTASQLSGHGIRRLWTELAPSYPHFEFLHGRGLGVLGTGKRFPEPVRELFALADDAEGTRRVRGLFELSGEALALRHAAAQAKDQLSRRDALYTWTRHRAKQLEQALDARLRDAATANRELTAREDQIRLLRESLAAYEDQIRGVRNSASWRLTAPLRWLQREIGRPIRSIRRSIGRGGS